MSAEIVSAGQDLDEVTVSVLVLPLPDDDRDAEWSVRALTAAWLRSQRSAHTRKAYFGDLSIYLSWCATAAKNPLTVKRADVDLFMSQAGGRTHDGSRELSTSTRARRLTALSSWFLYLESNEAVSRNPVSAVKRPTVDKDVSTTVGLSAREISRFMRAARAESGPQALSHVVVLGLMVICGLRVGEVCALDLSSFRSNNGHRTVLVHGKGDKYREIPVPPALARDLDRYLQWRVDQGQTLVGAAFVTSTGRRLEQPWIFRLVRRVAARAGLASAHLLSPHSLRHSAATAALDLGASLRDVQDWLGHKDPRTTRRYDLARGALDRSPTHLLDQLVGG